MSGGAREGDNFGRTLTAGDFNSDLFEDLAIGVPGEGSGTGAVNVIYGGSDGLAAPGNQIWSQNSDGIAGEGEEGDNFGGALAAGHFNRDGFADLAIGVFGAVNVIYGGRDGLAAPGNQIWNRDSDGIAVVEGGGLW